MPRQKVRQRWKCPHCGDEQTTPIPAVELFCGNHLREMDGSRPAMQLIEGTPAVTKKRLVNGMLETVKPK